MRFRPAVLALAVTLAIVLPTAAQADDDRIGRQYDHIFVIVEENTEFTGIIGNP